MFVCKNCKSIDKFELMFSPDYRGERSFSQRYNKKEDIEITVDGYTFVPDLAFMNDHAVCRYCGQIYIWDYAAAGVQSSHGGDEPAEQDGT